MIGPRCAIASRLVDDDPGEKQGNHRGKCRLQQAELSNLPCFPLQCLANPMPQNKSHASRNQVLRQLPQRTTRPQVKDAGVTGDEQGGQQN